MFFFVSKVNKNCNDPDCFLPIENINIQWNNDVGILSTCSKEQLFQMCLHAGSNQSYLEFLGKAINVGSDTATTITEAVTSGSLMVLDFATQIQLKEGFFTAGSLGNFNMQITCTVKNNTSETISASTNPYQLTLITVNSGVFINERSTSQILTGILSKQQVIDTNKQEVYSKSDVQRMVGGGFFDSLKSFAGRILPVARALAPIAKGALSAIPDPRAQLGAKALGAMGFGMSAGRKKDVRLE